MGDRYYMTQKNYKPKRKLKKDVVADLQKLLGVEVPGVDRMTIPNIEQLTEAIERKLLL